MVKIRLQRHGRKKAPYYHIVVADSRKKRDGRIIEDLGRYNPVLKTAMVTVDTERALYWLKTGAQPTETVERLLRKEGIFYRLHLERWKKTPEEIENTISEWKKQRDAGSEDTLTAVEVKKAALKAEEEAFKAEQKKAEQEAARKAEEDRKAKEKAAAEAKAAEEAAEAAAEETEAEAKTEVKAEAEADAEAEAPAADAEATAEETETPEEEKKD